MDAFDADVLIYAASPEHPLGVRVANLFNQDVEIVRMGSVILMSELLIKPTRLGWLAEKEQLLFLLGKLQLRPVDLATASLAVVLGAEYGCPPMDSLHLATAVNAGADRFITNNRRDFPSGRISQIDVVHPDQLD
jgi:predicted nucleic acid-binding protein